VIVCGQRSKWKRKIVRKGKFLKNPVFNATLNDMEASYISLVAEVEYGNFAGRWQCYDYNRNASEWRTK